MKFTTTLFSVFTLAGLSTAGPVAPKPPKPPGTTWLWSANFTGGDAFTIAHGPFGDRHVRPTTGGAFSGPKVKGTILPIGGEYGIFDALHGANGAFYADVMHTMKTDDGELIQAFVKGPSQTNGEIYINVKLETGSDKYYWLNTVEAFGVLSVSADLHSASYDAWILNPPQ